MVDQVICFNNNTCEINSLCMIVRINKYKYPQIHLAVTHFTPNTWTSLNYHSGPNYHIFCLDYIMFIFYEASLGGSDVDSE